MMNKVNAFKSKEELLESLSSKIISALNAGILKNGKASLLLSGGSTPKPLFEKLSKCDIAWNKVNIALVDERWIDEENKDSNALLIKTHLLKNCAKEAHFVSMYQKNIKAQDSELICSDIYKKNLF